MVKLPATRSAAGSIALLLLCLLPAAMIAALMLRPFGLADLGWQLRLGEAITAERSAWVADRFAARHLGEPIVPNAWLAQVIYAFVRDAAGWTGLRALDTLLWLSGLLIAAVPALRRGTAPLSLVLALLVGFVVALPTASIRPQSFAAPAFAAMLVLAMGRPALRRAVALAIPLFVVWQNLHPSVALAAVVLGTATLVQWHADRRSGARDYRVLGTLTALAALAMLATPAGARIFAFSAYNAQASRMIRATEWLPLWDPVNRTFLVAVLASAALAALAAWRRRADLSPIEWVAPAVCLVFSLGAARFILFYAIAIVPLVARFGIGSPVDRQDRRLPVAAGLAVSVALGLVAMIAMPLRIEPEAPVAAVAKLEQAAPPGTVFCDPAFGGTLIDRGNGRWTVSFDGRFYAYSPAELALLNRTADADVDVSEIDRTYRPVAYLLARLRSPGLIARLQQDRSRWRQIYADHTAVAFVPVRPVLTEQ